MSNYAKDRLIEMLEGSDEQIEACDLERRLADEEADAMDREGVRARNESVVEGIILDGLRALDHTIALAHADFRQQCDEAEFLKVVL